MNRFPRAATVAAFVALTTSTAFALPNPTDVIPAKGGPILITPIYHASLQIEYRGEVIQVDPVSMGNLTGAKKADLILITHTHPDHFDLKAITKLRGTGEIIAPSAAAVQLAQAGLKARPQTLHNGPSPVYPVSLMMNGGSISFEFPSGVKLQQDVRIRVEAVPAYNIVRGPKPGLKFHPKGEFNGYILTLGGKRIYIAGDTEVTPEMKRLKNIDVAFLPMNLPYTMTPQEAAQGARAFRPKIVYPYHYRFPFNKPNDNPQQFARALAGSGIQVRIRGWYAHPAGK